jgi:hypothetical protein
MLSSSFRLARVPCQKWSAVFFEERIEFNWGPRLRCVYWSGLSHTSGTFPSVVVLALDPGFAGLDMAEYDAFLRVIKILSTTSFGGEVKPSVPCKILRHVKDPYSMKEILSVIIHGHFLPSFSCFSTRCLCWLLPESCDRWIRKDQMEKHKISAMVAVYWTPCAIPHREQ